jgi:hypothetical protein
MKKYITVLIVLLTSCSKNDDLYPSPFSNTREGEFKISMQAPKDNNGYYHYKFNPNYNPNFNYTHIFAEASPITNERYIYNGSSVIEGKFDSDAFWIIGDSLAITIPLYNPFSSLYSSPYFTTPLPTRNKTVILSQFKGFIVPVVPTTGVYFKKYDSRMDDYIPKSNNLWTKRTIGPIPIYMKGDTITVYSKVAWECGNYSIQYPERTHKIDSLKLIIE